MEPNTQEHPHNMPQEASEKKLADTEASETTAEDAEVTDAAAKIGASIFFTEEKAEESDAPKSEEAVKPIIFLEEEPEMQAKESEAESSLADAESAPESNAAAEEESDADESQPEEPTETKETKADEESLSASDAAEEEGEEKKETPQKRRSKFAVGFLIGITVFILIAIGALITLWQFLKVYEVTRPATTMNHFMETLDDAFWSELVENELADDSLPFENKANIVKDTVSRIRSASYTYLLKSSETTEEKTVYRVLLGGKEVLTLTLIPSDKSLGFGLHEWTVEGYVLNERNLPLKQTTYTYTVPANALLSLNGAIVDSSYITKNSFLAPECTELEPAASCTMVTYDVALYSEPQVNVVLNNVLLSETEDGYYPYPASMWKTGLLIVAPTDAALYVNGVPLDTEKYSSGHANYTGTSFEFATNHTYTVYSLPALFDTPVITAELEGMTYTLPEANSTFMLDYPAYLKYTVNITVPTGALVYINGIPVDPMYMTASEVPLASVTPFQNHIIAVPTTDTYLVTGFFNQPQVTIAMSGNLQTVSSLDEETRTITWIASRVADDATLESYKNLALNYTKTYMKFVSDGYRNMYDNREAVYKLMISGTDSYKAITKIYGGLYYVIPSVLTYHTLEVSNVLCHSDEVFECTVYYETSQNTSGVVVENSGTIQLLFLKKSGAWKVASFALSQNS